ncbi:MAG: CocE/NonD family hydrolase [Bryobacteraceae bacterium]
MTRHLAALVASSCFAAVQFPEAYAPTNDVAMDNLVAIPMRDGVNLFADIYRPAAPGKYPVIISRTPYSTERAPSAYEAAVFFAQRGFVFVYQDVRGRHESEGKWEPFRNDIEDGYDTIEWVAKQPWSNGKVGMEGGSYLGHVQWRAAMSKPPHLVTIFPAVAATSLYHDWITLNGGWRLSFNFGWGPVRQESRIMQNTGPHTMEGGPEALNFDRMQRHLPLNDMQRLAGRNAQFYKDWIAHPDYDAYWKKLNAEEVMDQIGIPVHTFGGWFDIFSQGTLRGYALISKKGATETARKYSNLVIGPWGHGSSQKFGDLDFGKHAHVNMHALELRWFDHWLKGIDNGLEQEPPVKMYMMGRNEWTYENEYPPARAQYKKMYLQAGGKLSWSEPGDSAPDTYRYDPNNPVPSLGGNNCCGTPTPAGPKDQRPVEARGDVLAYTSEFLTEPVTIAGPVKTVLHAATDCVDTDFVAKLIDVFPDGRSMNMAEGIVRARYREGANKPKLLEPGKVYEFEIDMVGTAVEFQRGHRIRLDIASSHFPQFDRNPNTGEPFGTSSAVKVATQRVHHSRAHASHVVLPVLPR